MKQATQMETHIGAIYSSEISHRQDTGLQCPLVAATYTALALISPLHVVLPFMAMMQVDFRSNSRELKGLTRTATFTDPDMIHYSLGRLSPTTANQVHLM